MEILWPRRKPRSERSVRVRAVIGLAVLVAAAAGVIWWHAGSAGQPTRVRDAVIEHCADPGRQSEHECQVIGKWCAAHLSVAGCATNPTALTLVTGRPTGGS